MRLTILVAAALLAGCGSKPDPDAVTVNLREIRDPAPSAVYPDPDKVLGNGSDAEPEPERRTLTVERWSAPDLERVRYTQVVDQAGCRWWMPFPGSADEDGPDPVLGKNHRPICKDSFQEPDADVVEMDEEEALKEIAAGRAVRATKAAIARLSEGEAAEQPEEEEPEPDPTPTPTPAARTSRSTYGQPLITTRGRMATSLGNGLAMTHDGRLAIQVGGMAVPTHR